MKKLVLILLFSVLGSTGCSSTCKYNGCGSEVYKDGYCKTHFYIMEAGSIIEDWWGE